MSETVSLTISTDDDGSLLAETKAMVAQPLIREQSSIQLPLEESDSGLRKMSEGIRPVIDSEIDLGDIGAALRRMQSRDLFGKIVAHVP